MIDDKKNLQLAVFQARESVKQGGFPAGAVIAKDGKVISKGISLGFLLHDPTSHAETVSIREACQKLKTTDLAGATLYASLQPCLMCFSATNWAGISRIVYGCKKTNNMVSKGCYEGRSDLEVINKENNNKIELIFVPDFQEEILDLIQEWEK